MWRMVIGQLLTRRTSRHVRFSLEKPIVIRNDNIGDDDATATPTPTAANATTTATGELKPKQAATQPAAAPTRPVTITRSGRAVKTSAR